MNLIQDYEMWAAHEERENRKDALLEKYDNHDFVKEIIAEAHDWMGDKISEEDLYNWVVDDAFSRADDIGVELDDSDIEYISHKVAAVLEA